MAGVSTWVLSIAGICFISVIIDLSLPDGKMNAHIKNAISYIIILVVIMPLPKLLNGNYSSSDIFSEIEINIQDDYIFNLNQSKIDMMTDSIENLLYEKGIYGATVSISANIFETDMKIDAVYVDLYNVVISDFSENINIKTEVVSVVLSVVDIAKEKVIIYE